MSVYAGTHPLTKRPIRLRATVKGETQAKIELGKLLQQARDGRNPEAGVTMAKLLDEYAPMARWDVSTRQTNEGFIRRTLKPTIGHLKIRQVNGEILDKLYARLTRCRPAGSPRPWSGTRPMASPTALPATSQAGWCRPRSPVEPMCTAGRLRIASESSNAVMDEALQTVRVAAMTRFLERSRTSGPARKAPAPHRRSYRSVGFAADAQR